VAEATTVAFLAAEATIVARTLAVKATARALLEKDRRMSPACSSTTKKKRKRETALPTV